MVVGAEPLSHIGLLLESRNSSNIVSPCCIGGNCLQQVFHLSIGSECIAVVGLIVMIQCLVCPAFLVVLVIAQDPVRVSVDDFENIGNSLVAVCVASQSTGAWDPCDSVNCGILIVCIEYLMLSGLWVDHSKVRVSAHVDWLV